MTSKSKQLNHSDWKAEMIDILKILFFASSPEPKGELIRKLGRKHQSDLNIKKS